MAKAKTELREWISSGFTRVEDVAYVGLGLVLAVSALVLLGHQNTRSGLSMMSWMSKSSTIRQSPFSPLRRKGHPSATL